MAKKILKLLLALNLNHIMVKLLRGDLKKHIRYGIYQGYPTLRFFYILLFYYLACVLQTIFMLTRQTIAAGIDYILSIIYAY